MTSYECVIGNKTLPVQCVENLCGHSIAPYKIHAGKSVPIVKTDETTKMDEGELFAIETFGVAGGKGHVWEAPDCSHYMKNFDVDDSTIALRNPKAKALLAEINARFGTLAWCRRWIEEPFPRHTPALK